MCVCAFSLWFRFVLGVVVRLGERGGCGRRALSMCGGPAGNRDSKTKELGRWTREEADL